MVKTVLECCFLALETEKKIIRMYARDELFFYMVASNLLCSS